MPSLRLPPLRFLLTRIVAVCAAGLVVAIVVGCMNICVDRSVTVEDGLCKQSGTFTVKGGEEVDIYYPIPYGSPPNVTLNRGETYHDFVLVNQYPDHCRVRNTGSFGGEVTWVSKGVRQPAAPVVLPVQELPAAPVPVAGK